MLRGTCGIIGDLIMKIAFIQHFMLFIEDKIALSLHGRFYPHNVISGKIFYEKALKTGKQNVWFLCKTNFNTYRLRHTCSRGG